MSGNIATSPAPPLTSSDQLLDFFRRARRPRETWLVGVEQEKLGVRSTGTAVPYEGDAGIQALLQRLLPQGFSAVREGGHLLALERHAESITLEPGGQVEMSGPALPSADDCRRALRRHLAEVTAAG